MDRGFAFRGPTEEVQEPENPIFRKLNLLKVDEYPDSTNGKLCSRTGLLRAWKVKKKWERVDLRENGRHKSSIDLVVELDDLERI